MHSLLHLCIFLGGVVSQNDAANPNHTVVFASRFGEEADRDYNGWPDGWTRRRGPGFPHYIKVQLDFESSARSRGALRVDLNGGAVEVWSPAISIDDLHCYLLEGDIKTDGLVDDRAVISLTFLDAKKRPLRTFVSAGVGGTTDWTAVQLGPTNTLDGEPHFAMIGLRLDQSGLPDLHGTVWFNQVRLIQVPRLRVETKQRLKLYTDPTAAELQVRISGVREQTGEVSLELVDHSDHVVESKAMRVDWKPMRFTSRGTSEPELSPEFETRFNWKPQLTRRGFFCARAAMALSHGQILEGKTCLLVVGNDPTVRGQFGWSLARGVEPIADRDLIALVNQANLGWLKLPVWGDTNFGRQLAFIERLSEQNVNCVGVLDRPPDAVRSALTDVAALTAADLFNAPIKSWQPSVESVLVKYGMNVRYWQLGTDTDRSFVGYPELPARLTAIKKELESSGQSLHLGIGWDWIEELPDLEGLPLRFVCMSASPPLTAEELQSYLATSRNPQVARWVQIDPESLAAEEQEQRARSLVHQMLAGVAYGADCVYFLDPMHETAGLIDRDGSPTRLFLPWRTTALALAGASYLGEIELPRGSRNRIFVRGDRALMVVWSNRVQEESLYLGDQVTVHDMYGTEQAVDRQQERTTVTVGSDPVFVTGLHLGVARWRISLKLAESQIPSIPGVTFDQAVSFTNTFDQPVSGRAKLITPTGWLIQPSEFDFRLNAGEAFNQPVKITLPYGAESGLQRLRLEFEVFADRPHRFEVIRPIEVGLGDVLITVDTQLDDTGALEIEQQLTNNTDRPVRFACSVFARARRRQQFELVGPAEGQTFATFRLENGRALLGETIWLRASEIGGRRVLNYRFVAEP